MPVVQTYEVLVEGVGRRDYSIMTEFSVEPTIRSYQAGFNYYDRVDVPPNYSVGQAIFVVGSTQVVGVGTAWAAAMAGRVIKNNTGYQELWFEIASVTDATHLVLTETYYYLYAATVGVPADYTLGGKVINIAITTGTVVMLYDFIASRPNNNLVRLMVLSIDIEGVSAYIVDSTDFAAVEAHLSRGQSFFGSIYVVLFNYADDEDSFRFSCHGLYTTSEEHYMSLIRGEP